MFGGRESNQVPSGKKLTAAQTCTVYKLAQLLRIGTHVINSAADEVYRKYSQ